MWHGEIQVRECGVRAADLEAQRAALIEFAAEMYRPLVRCDQRAKGEQYVRGLLLEGRRKSIQPMAARLPDRDEHGLQQFITDSPWEDEPVRRRLARRMTPEIEPEGWIVDDTGLPKHGRFSPEVAHQYCGALGKTANCQVLVSVNAASDRASCPLQWRLFLAACWDEDVQRRRRARIPEEVRHVPKWQLALEIIDQLLEWDWSAGWCRPTAATATSPRSGRGLRSASLSRWCRSRASPPPSRPTRLPSRPSTRAAAARPSAAIRTSPPASRTSCWPTAASAPCSVHRSDLCVDSRTVGRGPVSPWFSARRVFTRETRFRSRGGRMSPSLQL